MTEKSYFWDGLVTGDATLAPVTEAVFNSIVWKTIHTRENNEGVVNSYLNDLVVTSVGVNVQVSTGAALVQGTLYINDSPVTLSVEIPSSNPRRDMVVLRKSYSGQTVRAAIRQGSEAAAPVAPTLLQTNITFEIPLAELTVETDGTISVVDKREGCDTPLYPKVLRVKLAEYIPDAPFTTVSFENISQDFKHLELLVQMRKLAGETWPTFYLQLNGTGYGQYYQLGTPVLYAPEANIQGSLRIYQAEGSASAAGTDTMAHQVAIMNYSNSSFYKNVISFGSRGGVTASGVGGGLARQGSLYLSTLPITQIKITSADEVQSYPMLFSLYGLR